MGSGSARFTFQSALRRAGTRGRGSTGSSAGFGAIARCLPSRPPGCCSFSGRRQFHAGPAGFRQTDGDGLFSRSRAMLAFANVLHLLAHEFAGLSGGRFTFTRILACSFDRFLFGHSTEVTLLRSNLDVVIYGRNCSQAQAN
jgi:hypothetical protein